MKILIDMLAGLMAMLAAAALSQFGIDLVRPSAPAEVKRMPACQPAVAREDSAEKRSC